NVLKNDGTLRSGFVTTADALSKSETVDPKDKKTLQQLTSNVVAQLPDKQTLKPLLVPNADSGYLKPLFVPDAAYTIPGGLLSIILISLGAPFWFNALKDLTNLRSTVAKREEDQRAGQGSPAADARGAITFKDRAAHA